MKQNTTAHMEKSEFIINGLWISVTDFKNEIHNEKMLRLYKDSPDSVSLQLRAHCAIDETGKGVKRDMVASSHLNKADCLALAKKLIELSKQLSL